MSDTLGSRLWVGPAQAVIAELVVAGEVRGLCGAAMHPRDCPVGWHLAGRRDDLRQPKSGRPPLRTDVQVWISNCSFVRSIIQCGSKPPGPASLGPRTLQETLKTVWDSKLGLEIKKKFGAQNSVWSSNACLAFKTWSGDFVFDICALEFIALSSETSFPQGLNNFL